MGRCGPLPRGMVSIYERIDAVAKEKSWLFKRTQRAQEPADTEIGRGAPCWINTVCSRRCPSGTVW